MILNVLLNYKTRQFQATSIVITKAWKIYFLFILMQDFGFIWAVRKPHSICVEEMNSSASAADRGPSCASILSYNTGPRFHKCRLVYEGVWQGVGREPRSGLTLGYLSVCEVRPQPNPAAVWSFITFQRPREDTGLKDVSLFLHLKDSSSSSHHQTCPFRPPHVCCPFSHSFCRLTKIYFIKLVQQRSKTTLNIPHRELKKLSFHRVVRVRQKLSKHIFLLLDLFFIYFRHAAEREDWIICFRQGLHLTELKRSHPSSNTRRQLGVSKVPYLVTGLFLAGKWRGAWACLSVMEYSCLRLCFMHRWDAWNLISLSLSQALTRTQTHITSGFFWFSGHLSGSGEVHRSSTRGDQAEIRGGSRAEEESWFWHWDIPPCRSNLKCVRPPKINTPS